MEHPFISSLADKSFEELQSSLDGLHNKLNYAYKSGNVALISQLRMIIESYRTEYNKRMDEMIKKQQLNAKISIEGHK